MSLEEKLKVATQAAQSDYQCDSSKMCDDPRCFDCRFLELLGTPRGYANDNF